MNGPIQTVYESHNNRVGFLGALNLPDTVLSDLSLSSSPINIDYTIPTELNPARSKNIISRLPKGVTISVGSERGFITAGLSPKTSHLLQVDYFSNVVRANRTNLSLQQLSNGDIELFNTLRMGDFELWTRLLEEDPERFINYPDSLSELSWRYWNSLMSEKPFQELANPDSSFFEGVSYLHHPEQFNRIYSLGLENKIEILQLDLQNEETLDLVISALEQLELKVNLLDLSSCWWSDFISPEGMSMLLNRIASVAHPEGILMVTDCNRYETNPLNKWSYYGFTFNQLQVDGGAKQWCRLFQERGYSFRPEMNGTINGSFEFSSSPLSMHEQYEILRDNSLDRIELVIESDEIVFPKISSKSSSDNLFTRDENPQLEALPIQPILKDLEIQVCLSAHGTHPPIVDRDSVNSLKQISSTLLRVEDKFRDSVIKNTSEVIDQVILPQMIKEPHTRSISHALPAAEDWIAFTAMGYLEPDQFMMILKNFTPRAAALLMGMMGPHLRRGNIPDNEDDYDVYPTLLNTFVPELLSYYNEIQFGDYENSEIAHHYGLALMNGLLFDPSWQTNDNEPPSSQAIADSYIEYFEKFSAQCVDFNLSSVVKKTLELFPEFRSPDVSLVNLFSFSNEVFGHNEIVQLATFNEKADIPISIWDVITNPNRGELYRVTYQEDSLVQQRKDRFFVLYKILCDYLDHPNLF